MKAATILAAIGSMAAAETLTRLSDPYVFGNIMQKLEYARIDLENELKRELPDVKVEHGTD